MTQYDKLDILGDTSTTCEKVFYHIVVSAFLPARSITRSPSNYNRAVCPYCTKAKNLLKNKGIEYEEKNIAEGHKIEDLLALVPNAKTMPQIWLDEEHIGGYSDLQKKLNEM